MLATKAPRFFFGAHSKYAIIGGGTGGLNVSAHLRKVNGIKDSDIRVFEPRLQHYYQPGWTLVSGDLFDIKDTVRNTRDLIPKNIPITELEVTKVDPTNNSITTEDGDKYTYDYLIIATGNKLNYEAIEGAVEALEDPNCPVGSAYHKPYAQKQKEILKNFKGGHFVFQEPPMPIKCAGAPQKVTFLSECYLRRHNLREKSQVTMYMAKGVIFGVPKYGKILERIHKEKNINIQLNQKLIKIDGKNRVATFESSTGGKTNVNFDAFHLVPPQLPPAYIKESGIADASGYVEINIHTLQHQKYRNIFCLGDSANLPTSKTAAAIFSQTPILINNLLVESKHPGFLGQVVRYEGYTSCPITIGDNKLLLAEFKYDNVVDETFNPIDQGTPKSIFFRMKKDVFPFVYWNLVCKGNWYGRKHILPLIPGYNLLFKPKPYEQ